MKNNSTVHLVWPLLLLYLIYLLSKLIWFDNLTSLANDSVHYLVMARHYSPWVTETLAISNAWLIQDFPPFFPWLLAFTGTAHSFLYAHILVVTLGLSSLYFFYLLSSRWLNNKSLAIFPLLIFALSPGFLLGLQGILSESLYILLVIIFLLVYSPSQNKSITQALFIALLLSSILLTRTVGIALLLAIVTQSFFSSASRKKIQYQPFLIAFAAIALYFLLMAIWGPVKESHYLDMLIRYLTGKDLYQVGTGTEHTFSTFTQISSIVDSWISFWIIYWRVDTFSASYYLVMLLLLLSLSGLFLRIARNKYDAWYTLFYLLILLAWPHPGQMFRLLFPVMPFLLIYSGYALRTLLNQVNFKNKDFISYGVYLFVLVSILPSHVFIHTRANIAASEHMIPVYQIFRRADLEVAMQDLLLQNQLLSDFKRVKETVFEEDKVMYFLPAYIAVLSDRSGISAPSPVDGQSYRQIAEKNKAKYIFLTHLHPRNTRPDYSGFKGAQHLQGGTKIVWCGRMKNEKISSCLFRITDPTIPHG